MLAAISEYQAVEAGPTTRLTQQHTLSGPVQPASQARYSPAQLTVGGKHGALIAHPPQTATPVLYLEIGNLRTGFEIEFHHTVVQARQVSTARDFFLNKGDLALRISNQQNMRLLHA